MKSESVKKMSLACGVLLVVLLSVGLWWTHQHAESVNPIFSPIDLESNETFLFMTRTNEPFDGLEHFYTSGALKSRSQVISNGVLDGLSLGWYTNGQLQVSEYFKQGVSHGLRTKWYADGAKQSEAEIVDGRIHGAFKRWHPNGTLAIEASFKEGKPDGTSRAFYPSGYLKSEVKIRDGEMIEQNQWDDQKCASPEMNQNL